MFVFKLITAMTFTIITACQSPADKSAVAAEPTHKPVIQAKSPAVKPEERTQSVKEVKEDLPKKIPEPVTAIDSEVLYLLLTGETALQRDQYPIALEAYLAAAKRVNDARIAEKAARIAVYLANLPKTKIAVSLWLAKDPNNVTARQIALSTALNDKNQSLFIEHLAMILNSNPVAFEETLSEMPKAIQKSTDIPFIDQSLEVLAKQYPQKAIIFLTQAVLATKQNKINIALEKTQYALKLQPNWEKAIELETKLWKYLGGTFFKNKQYSEAINAFEKIKQGPLAFEAELSIVSALIEQQQWMEADQRLDALLAENTDSDHQAQILVMKAEIYSQQKNYSKAITLLTQGLENTPDHRELLYARALIAEKMNRFDQLEADLQKILIKNPKDVGALNALGYSLVEYTTRYQEAENYLQQALKLQPEDAVIIDSYGWLQFKKGDLPNALKYLQSAHKKLAESEITAHLAEVLWILGRKKEAEQLIVAAIKQYPNDEFLLKFQDRFLKNSVVQP